MTDSAKGNAEGDEEGRDDLGKEDEQGRDAGMKGHKTALCQTGPIKVQSILKLGPNCFGKAPQGKERRGEDIKRSDMIGCDKEARKERRASSQGGRTGQMKGRQGWTREKKNGWEEGVREGMDGRKERNGGRKAGKSERKGGAKRRLRETKRKVWVRERKWTAVVRADKKKEVRKERKKGQLAWRIWGRTEGRDEGRTENVEVRKRGRMKPIVQERGGNKVWIREEGIEKRGKTAPRKWVGEQEWSKERGKRGRKGRRRWQCHGEKEAWEGSKEGRKVEREGGKKKEKKGENGSQQITSDGGGRKETKASKEGRKARRGGIRRMRKGKRKTDLEGGEGWEKKGRRIDARKKNHAG